MPKIAYVFPGQGSQVVGMGLDIYQEFDAAREIFESADAITGMPLTRMCFEGPMSLLTQTENLQPALTAANLALWSVLQKYQASYQFAAGHSLGEYSALCAAGVLSPEDALRLVFERGRAMQRHADRLPGAMRAVIGLSLDVVQTILAAVGRLPEFEGTEIVSVANHNTETQIVITGSKAAVAKAAEFCSEKGAKAVPLKVSGPWHSPLMQGAAEEFAEVLRQCSFQIAALPVALNVTAELAVETEEIRRVMMRQLNSPVRWYESVRRLAAEGVDVWVEVGPGKVLSNIIRKIVPKDTPCRIFAVNDLKSLHAYLDAA